MYGFNVFTGNLDLKGTGGSSTGATLTREDPPETPDGVITDFTVAHEPVLVEIDGNFRVDGFGYTYATGIISVDPLLAPVQSIVAFYNAV